MLLSVENLSTVFPTRRGLVQAVDNVSFTAGKGEVLSIVGESGSGKSVTSLSIMGLVFPPGRIAGRIVYKGEDLLRAGAARLRQLRGNEISMIFQEPMTSLNPVYTVRFQLVEAIRTHLGLDRAAADARAVEMLSLVGIPSPEKRMENYPHEMSGGMRQRVMIAMALSCNPELLIADEPTTALDVTIQAQILDLLFSLRDRLGMGVILITHDLGVVAEAADRVIVMYCGRVMEEAPVKELFRAPLHPYTRGLIASIPRMDVEVARLPIIPGQAPDPARLPRGCPFAPRCADRTPRCGEALPALTGAAPNHRVRCFGHSDAAETAGEAA